VSSRLFTVRLWAADVGGEWECRGNVREVASGAYRNFRDWSDLTGFLTERMQGDGRTDPPDEGDAIWPRLRQ
jgi:hypothetical protein